jgi:hypothetical protein
MSLAVTWVLQKSLQLLVEALADALTLGSDL